MGWRDILMLLLGYGCVVPAILDAYYALLAYCWLSFMKPQSLAWNPNVQAARITLVIGVILVLRWMASPAAKLRVRGPVLVFLLLWVWFGITTLTSTHYNLSADAFLDFCKVAIATLLVSAVVRTRVQFKWLLVLMALCAGFWGAKMGTFFFHTATESFTGGPIGMDNNDTAMFIAMGLPLLIFGACEVQRPWLRRLMYAAAFFCIPGVILTTSRGGMLALLTAVGLTIWRKTGRWKGVALAYVGLVLILALAPTQASLRYSSIREYKKDDSAMGRIAAWNTALAMAAARPIGGVGFGQETFIKEYSNYQKDPEDRPHAAHSVWFALLGETGYVGLGLYGWMILAALRQTRQVMRLSVQREKRRGAWDWNYAAGLQCTLVAFVVGSTFLSHPRFEYVFVLCAMTLPLTYLSSAEQRTASPILDASPLPARAAPAVERG